MTCLKSTSATNDGSTGRSTVEAIVQRAASIQIQRDDESTASMNAVYPLRTGPVTWMIARDLMAGSSPPEAAP